MSSNDKVQLVRVSAAHQGQRLDNYLIRFLKGVPRSRVYRLIRRGEVRVNKKRCKPERKLEYGDELRIPPFSGPDSPVPAKPGPALQQLLIDNILLEDEQMIILNKPAGLAVHGGSGIRLGLIEAMRQIKPEWQQLELAHRLDRETSGCLVLSKNSSFLKLLHNELKAKTVDKRYLALVHGYWPDSLREVDVPLQKNELSSGERIVRVAASGKPSLTRFKVLERYPQATLIEAMPATGRTHQIRVHCQHAGHPIVGDSKYQKKSLSRALAGVKTLCLHAAKIRFSLAGSSAPVEANATLDSQMSNILDQLKKEVK